MLHLNLEVASLWRMLATLNKQDFAGKQTGLSLQFLKKKTPFISFVDFRPCTALEGGLSRRWCEWFPDM